YRALAQKLYRSSEAPAAHREIVGADQIDKVIEIDQAPIGRTPRSNPATYTGVFAPIRDLFAMLPESRERGYRPGRFSFNVKGGRCEACQGDGLRRIEMNFLPDVLQRLVDLGNTVLIIEHHLDVIKQADWIIDLGPEGGEGGGRIVAQGPPELVARTKKSYTGQVLARVLNLNGNAANGRDNGNSGHNK